MRIVLIVSLLISSLPSHADKVDEDPCPKRLVAAPMARLMNGLARVFRIPAAAWEIVEGPGEPVVLVGGLTEEEFQRARETAQEMKHMIAQALQGKIRGFGRYEPEQAALHASLWGILVATSLAGYFLIPPDTHHLVGRVVLGIAAFAGLKTLRWFRTLEDGMVRLGYPESNLFPALGPLQSPIQYWLKEVYGSGAMGAVIYLAREAAPVVRGLFREGLPAGNERLIRLDLAPPPR